MDEPFGALDALTREQMNLELLRIWRESGKTIVFVTHDIAEAVFLGSHCGILTARPARMAEYLTIDLPACRELSLKATPAFGALVARVYAALGLSNPTQTGSRLTNDAVRGQISARTLGRHAAACRDRARTHPRSEASVASPSLSRSPLAIPHRGRWLSTRPPSV